jgi:hypothetical protein
MNVFIWKNVSSNLFANICNSLDISLSLRPLVFRSILPGLDSGEENLGED